MPTLIYLILGLVSVIGGILMVKKLRDENQTRSNIARLGSEAPTLTEGGHTFRDLNKNGKLDIFEDARQPIDVRVEDLLRQMTAAEKAGMLFINGSVVNADGSIDEVYERLITALAKG